MGACGPWEKVEGREETGRGTEKNIELNEIIFKKLKKQHLFYVIYLCKVCQGDSTLIGLNSNFDLSSGHNQIELGVRIWMRVGKTKFV